MSGNWVSRWLVIQTTNSNAPIVHDLNSGNSLCVSYSKVVMTPSVGHNGLGCLSVSGLQLCDQSRPDYVDCGGPGIWGNFLTIHPSGDANSSIFCRKSGEGFERSPLRDVPSLCNGDSFDVCDGNNTTTTYQVQLVAHSMAAPLQPMALKSDSGNFQLTMHCTARLPGGGGVCVQVTDDFTDPPLFKVKVVAVGGMVKASENEQYCVSIKYHDETHQKYYRLALGHGTPTEVDPLLPGEKITVRVDGVDANTWTVEAT